MTPEAANSREEKIVIEIERSGEQKERGESKSKITIKRKEVYGIQDNRYVSSLRVLSSGVPGKRHHRGKSLLCD
jgi:hypothetical protein